MLTNILFWFVAINLMVVVHSGGHFAVARALGVAVERVSVGLVWPMVEVASARTVWQICWLPLGGFVRTRSTAADAGALGAKLAVVVAGPVANLALAFAVILAVVVTQGLPTATGAQVSMQPVSLAQAWGIS